jgi:hypothetical protein
MAWLQPSEEMSSMTETPQLPRLAEGEASPLLIDQLMPNHHASRVELVVVRSDP